MLLSDEIKMLRHKLDLNMRDFADKLGVSASSVCLWENGKRNPRKSIIKLMEKLVD